MKRLKLVRREITYWLIRALAAAVSALPRRCALFLGSVAGTTGYTLMRRERTRALRNLALAYPRSTKAWRQRIARGCFRHLAWNAIDFMYFSVRDPTDLAAIVEFVGQTNIDDALRGGTGVMCIAGHVGNWELLGAHLAHRGYRLAVIAKRLYYHKLNRWVVSLRERQGLRVLDRDGPPGAILSWLRTGSLIGVLLDQDTRTRGAFVDFFGQPAYTPVGPALLAVRARAPLVALFMKRVPGHAYRVVVRTPRRPGKGPARQRCLELTNWATAQIEQAIREDPEQWVWMHRRWRRKP